MTIPYFSVLVHRSGLLALLLRRSRRVALVASVGCYPAVAVAEPPADVHFNRNFLIGGAAESLDLAAYEAGRTMAPGHYTLDVHVNGEWVARAPVRLADAGSAGLMMPCLADADLVRWGVRSVQPGTDMAGSGLAGAEACLSLAERVPFAEARLDPLQLALHLNVPQRFLVRPNRDWVDPSQWDQGAPAALLDYTANLNRIQGRAQHASSASFGYRLGLNTGPWRLRHDGFLRWEDRGHFQKDSGETYLQRDIQRWEATLLAGQGYTSGELFSSMAFTGVRVASDDRMLPQSLRGYAPIVEGVAETAARIQVYQQGRLLHDANVAPGPFRIDDLYATAYNGDLGVVVTESDGREHRYTQPFSAVPQLLRPGQHRFSATAGRAGHHADATTVPLLEGTWRQGITATTTVHSGIQLATDYGAVVAGAALNTRVGGFSSDLTASQARVQGGAVWRGYAHRTAYSRDIASTGTYLSVAAYRYSTRHYMDLADSLWVRAGKAPAGASPPGRARSRFDISTSQALPGRWGRVWLNGSWTSYWDDSGTRTTYAAGYSHGWRSISYAITARRSHASSMDGVSGSQDASINLTVSMPLGRAPGSPSLLASSSFGGNALQTRVGIASSASDRMNYFGGVERTAGGNMGADAGLYYQGDRGTANASATWSAQRLQLSAGAAGGVVLHRGGITLAHALGETFGLVHAPDAQGATVDHGRTRVDGRGYAVVPHLTPYRTARVDIDPRGIPDTVRFASTSAIGVPTAGAVIQLPFVTEHVGSQHTFITRTDNRQPIPFGARIVDEQGEVLGIVGQSGQAWFGAATNVRRARIRWQRSTQNNECEVDLSTDAPVRLCAAVTPETAERPQLHAPPRPTLTP